MAEQSSEPTQSNASGDFLAGDGLLAELMQMVSAFWASRERNKLLMLAAALVAVVGATAYEQIQLNAWNRPFYNALTNKDMATFIGQLGVFAELAGILLVLNVVQMWLNQTCKVFLRQGLMHDLLNEWLVPLRAFRLSYVREIGANPDQRLHADAQHLTELTTDLGIACCNRPSSLHPSSVCFGCIREALSCRSRATASVRQALWSGALSSMPARHLSSVGASAAR